MKTQAAYEFNAEKGLIEDRFEIHLRNHKVTALADDWAKAGLSVWASNNHINFKFDKPELAQAEISLFDITGKQIWAKDNKSQGELTFDITLAAPQQVIIVKVENKEGLFVRKLYVD